MRKALFVVCVLFAVPSFAQQQQPSKFQLSVFASNLGYTESRSTGSNFHGGLGAALEYRWNRQWALELQIASEDRARFDRTYPVDLLAHYRFENSTRWKPFLGAGVRYERDRFSRADQTVFEIDGGVHFMITPSLSLRLDAKQTLFDDDGNLDAGIKPSIGFGWHF